MKKVDELASKARMTMSTTEQGLDDFIFECEPSGVTSRQSAAAAPACPGARPFVSYV